MYTKKHMLFRHDLRVRIENNIMIIIIIVRSSEPEKKKSYYHIAFTFRARNRR